MHINYCDFFGGVDAVKKKVAKAISKKRVKLGLTPKKVDKLLRSYGEADAPRCANIEQHPELLTSSVLSHISIAFGMNVKGLFPSI